MLQQCDAPEELRPSPIPEDARSGGTQVMLKEIRAYVKIPVRAGAKDGTNINLAADSTAPAKQGI